VPTEPLGEPLPTASGTSANTHPNVGSYRTLSEARITVSLTPNSSQYVEYPTGRCTQPNTEPEPEPDLNLNLNPNPNPNPNPETRTRTTDAASRPHDSQMGT
jgi:hypothetical protein